MHGDGGVYFNSLMGRWNVKISNQQAISLKHKKLTILFSLSPTRLIFTFIFVCACKHKEKINKFSRLLFLLLRISSTVSFSLLYILYKVHGLFAVPLLFFFIVVIAIIVVFAMLSISCIFIV